MADLSLAGAAVLRAKIVLPRVGVWHADVTVDTDAVPSGAVSLSSADGALSLLGTVQRAQVWQGRAELRIKGGAGGLDQFLPARFYQNATVGVALRDIVRESGEALSNTSDAGVLGAGLASWSRERQRGGEALAALLDRVGGGATWRVLQDGSVWVGTESWPNVEVPGDLLEVVPEHDRATLGTDTVYGLLAPGTTWLDRHVTLVEHFTDSTHVRTTVQFEAASTDTRPVTSDRASSVLDAIIRHSLREVLYHALWPATVVTGGAGVLDVQPDGDRFPVLVGVPVKGSAPGETGTILANARVLLGFEAGDPSRPFVFGFERGSAGATEWQIDSPTIKLGAGATRGVARLADTVDGNAALLAWITDVEAKLFAAAHPVTTPFVGTGIGAVSSASTKSAAE